MVIRGKASKYGNLLVPPRALAASFPPRDASLTPKTRRCDFPLPCDYGLSPCPLLLGRFGQHDASPAIQPVFHPTTCRDGPFPLRCVIVPTNCRVVSPPRSAQCSRMRVPDACVRVPAVCAGARAFV